MTEENARKFELKGKASEEVVQELAYKSFLREWCFPNPKRHNGKELCDLLVEFDGTIFLFQIKDIEFKGKTERYAREAYSKPTRQVLGAERYLMSLSDPLGMKNPDGFEFKLSTCDIKRIFRVVLSVGNGPSPVNSYVILSGKAVHTFDRTIGVVLSHLSTVSDFHRYVLAKEELVLSEVSPKFIAEREIDLLAAYSMNMSDFEFLGKFDPKVIGRGDWEKFAAHRQFRAKQEHDRISYFWDQLIQITRECPGDDYRAVAREMSRPNRFQRRMLAHSYFEAYHLACQRNSSFRRTFPNEGVTFVFLFRPRGTPREQRVYELNDVVIVARSEYPNNTKVVGLATEGDSINEHTHDFVFLDFPEWSDENKAVAAELKNKYGIYSQVTPRPITYEEYPDPATDSGIDTPEFPHMASGAKKKIGRNCPCPCGSGKKFKRCHGSDV